jgi:hypothetical protein
MLPIPSVVLGVLVISGLAHPTSHDRQPVRDRSSAPQVFTISLDDCVTTHAALRSGLPGLRTSNAQPTAAVRFCSATDTQWSCRIQTGDGTKSRDDRGKSPELYTVQEYSLPDGDTPMLSMTNSEGTHEWMRINLEDLTVVSTEIIDSLDRLHVVVCGGRLRRGHVATKAAR